MSDKQQEIQELAKVFEQLRGKDLIHVDIEPDAGFMLLAQLQLALRHPANRGPSAESIRQFAIGLQQRLVQLVPQIQSVLEKGWHPEFDVTPDQQPDKRVTYQHLALDIQEEVLANSIALSMACTALADLTKQPVEAFINEVSRLANAEVDQMTDFAVIEAVKNLDRYRETN